MIRCCACRQVGVGGAGVGNLERTGFGTGGGSAFDSGKRAFGE
jgi:hypothetical protein